MQLSPSAFPIDPNLLGLLVPGAVPGAAPATPVAAGAPAAVSFAELLPGVEPAAAGPGAGAEMPPAAMDAPLAGARPEMPGLMAEPRPFPRFVTPAPEVSPGAPTAVAANEDAPSLPVATDAKDKVAKPSVPLKRQAARNEQPKKESAPELVFSSTTAAPVAIGPATAPIADENEGCDSDSEPPQRQPGTAVPAAPATVANLTSAIETAPTSFPVAETTPVPASRESPHGPQGTVRGKPQSGVSLTSQSASQPERRFPILPRTPDSPREADQGKPQPSLPAASQAPERDFVVAPRPLTPVQPVAQSEAIVPTPPATSWQPPGGDGKIPESNVPLTSQTPEPTPVWARRLPTMMQSTPVDESVVPALSQTMPRLPQGIDREGQPQSSPASQALEHSRVWAVRPPASAQPIVVTGPAITNQPVAASIAPKEIEPPSPAVTSSTPPSAETIEAMVAPALEPNLSARPEVDPREGRENFAEPADVFRVNFEPAERAAPKTFVSTEVERLTPRAKTVGIGIAKPAAAMPPRFSFTPTPHPAFEYAPVALAASGERAAFVAEAPAAAPATAPQEVPTAQHAVEAVLRAVDHVATREQHSVNLHFSVGETDLKVRVELRADEVRATFSTDSAELRSALSHEWQAVARSDAGSSVRIAPASFTSDQSTTTFSGDGSSRDRQQQHSAPQAQNEFAQGRAGFGRPASPASSAARPEIRPPSLFVHAGSRHLSTLA